MIFKLNRKVENVVRSDKVTRESKSKALLTINLNMKHVNGMTHFYLALSINLNTQHDNDSKWKIGKNDNFVQMTSVWRKADEKEFEAGWADVRVTASKSI